MTEPLTLPSDIYAHSTVTPALQRVQRIVKTSPLAAHIILPRRSAEDRIYALYKRYPSIIADDLTRSALRRVGMPSVSAVIMPPKDNQVSVILLTQIAPDEREVWSDVLEPKQPLTWRNYELTTHADMLAASYKYKAAEPISDKEHYRITWRLSKAARKDYERTIRRLIHGRKPRRKNAKQEPPKGTTRTPAGVRVQLERLSEHLANYPGLSGIRTDTWMLSRYAAKMWAQQYPNDPAPNWLRHPYTTLVAAKFEPLDTLW